jgi:hypothetical protein
MTNILLQLKNNPVLGILSGLASSIMSVNLTNLLQFSGVCLGIVIALLTIYAKCQEIRINKRKLKDEKSKR